MSITLPIVMALIGLIIAGRILAHFLDVARFKNAVRQHDWHVIDVRWAPFAQGFVLEKHNLFMK
jgi:hypothetical protein